ncbi:MAG: hypothetical protein N5P05_000541 [Chroococcopsis gigantea SAG 12.99]|jgi:predicted RNA-binding protein with PUA-like domain|nr:EVE domain-containing protein [Chlorogloea purpurea SAG 13.99]MDV2998935.1 hypothetical protein [Chroococcopsis gigantea SAG 12.99]
MKSEPAVYGIEDLEKEGETLWDGVRNYQARNYLRAMTPGDLVFFYHSNTKVPGIVGLARVKETGVIDPSQFNPDSPYFDPKSSHQSPRWDTVSVAWVETFPRPLSLATLKEKFSSHELLLVRKGNRLSVMPVERSIAELILSMI